MQQHTISAASTNHRIGGAPIAVLVVMFGRRSTITTSTTLATPGGTGGGGGGGGGGRSRRGFAWFGFASSRQSSSSSSSTSSSAMHCSSSGAIGRPRLHVLPGVRATTCLTVVLLVCLETVLLSTATDCAKKFYMHWNTTNSMWVIQIYIWNIFAFVLVIGFKTVFWTNPARRTTYLKSQILFRAATLHMVLRAG